MLEIGVLKNFDSGTYKAGVQLAGSLTTYFDDISVAKNIPSAAMVIGNYVIVAIPGGNPKDAVVIAAWPQGSPGGGTFLDLSDTPSSYEGQARKLITSNDAEDALIFVSGNQVPAVLIDMVRAANFVFNPTASGWTVVTTGAGNVRQEPMRNLVEIKDANSGSALAYCACMGFNIGGNYGRINWDKHFYIIFNYSIYRSEADLVRRIQVLYAIPTISALSNQGLGFRVENLAMVGESYGTARGTVSLGNLVEIADPNYEMRQVVIELDPDTPAVRFYINGSLAGSITDSNYIPSGIAPGSCYVSHSITRPSTGASGVASVYMQGKFWQKP